MDDEPLHTNPNLAYAVQMVHATCCLAGSASYLADIREDLRDHGIIRAVRDHDTPALFDWLIKTLSFQGISDTVAAGYIAEHGVVRWSEIAEALSRKAIVPEARAGTGGFTTAGTTRGLIRALSRPTSMPAPCPAIRCGTAASTRWRTACFCSCVTLPMPISSAGSTNNWPRSNPHVSGPAARPVERL